MALKIRLRQQGRKNRTLYRLVVADARSPRDGKYVEMLGWYNPIETESDKSIYIKTDRVQHWLNVGAQFTDNVRALMRKNAPHIVQGETEKELAYRAKQAVKRRSAKAE